MELLAIEDDAVAAFQAGPGEVDGVAVGCPNGMGGLRGNADPLGFRDELCAAEGGDVEITNGVFEGNPPAVFRETGFNEEVLLPVEDLGTNPGSRVDNGRVGFVTTGGVAHEEMEDEFAVGSPATEAAAFVVERLRFSACNRHSDEPPISSGDVTGGRNEFAIGTDDGVGIAGIMGLALGKEPFFSRNAVLDPDTLRAVASGRIDKNRAVGGEIGVGAASAIEADGAKRTGDLAGVEVDGKRPESIPGVVGVKGDAAVDGSGDADAIEISAGDGAGSGCCGLREGDGPKVEGIAIGSSKEEIIPRKPLEDPGIGIEQFALLEIGTKTYWGGGGASGNRKDPPIVASSEEVRGVWRPDRKGVIGTGEESLNGLPASDELDEAIDADGVEEVLPVGRRDGLAAVRDDEAGVAAEGGHLVDTRGLTVGGEVDFGAVRGEGGVAVEGGVGRDANGGGAIGLLDVDVVVALGAAGGVGEEFTVRGVGRGEGTAVAGDPGGGVGKGFEVRTEGVPNRARGDEG